MQNTNARPIVSRNHTGKLLHENNRASSRPPGQTLAQVQILIGNGKAETFELEIDKIWVK